MTHLEHGAHQRQHDLAPCPFCGSHAQDDFIEGVSYIIECYACDASTGCQDSAEAAIAAWNRRTDATRAAPAAGFFVTTGEVTFHPAPAATPALDMVGAPGRIVRNPDGSTSTLTTEYERSLESDLAAIRDLFRIPNEAGDLTDLWSEAMSESRAVLPYVAAQITAMAKAQDEAQAAGDAGVAQTCRSGEKVQAEQDAREIAEIWDAAKAEAAMYVEAHCIDGEQHAEAIMSVKRPTIRFTAGSATEKLPDDLCTVGETLSAMLWLYRRLPRGYGRPPHIEQPIQALAKHVGINIANCLTERGAAEGEGHAQ